MTGSVQVPWLAPSTVPDMDHLDNRFVLTNPVVDDEGRHRHRSDDSVEISVGPVNLIPLRE